MTMTSASSTYFEKVAGQWDQLRSDYFTEAVRDAALAKSYLQQGMIVADVGGGTGFMSAGLAPLVQKVHLLDGSQAMLDVARKNLAGFDNVEYHLADGQALSLPDASVDAVFANMYLHHCPEPMEAVREMARILKPGGRLTITDLDQHGYTWLKDAEADVWLGFDRQQVRAWFADAGLVNVLVDCTGQSCCGEVGGQSVAGGTKQTVKVGIFLATGTRRVRMREQVEQAYAGLALGGCGCGSKASPSEESSEPEVQTSSSCCSMAESQSEAACCGPSESQVGISCCSSQSAPVEDSANALMYTPDDLSSVPAEAGEISLGCGNPIALANLKPGEVVVDIGSGGGIDCFLAAKRVGAEGKVIGVDMTPAMLERARKTALRNGIANVEFRRGQAEALPVEDQSVDVIISNCVINLTEDKARVFGEVFRVLRPGGRLEVSDVVTGGSFPLDSRQDAAGWADCVSGALPEQEYLDLIAQAGFQDVIVRRRATAGEVDGVKVFSAIVSALKPGSPAA